MEPWLLFFDIDGTLLDNDTNQVPDSTIKALKKAQAAGHKIFLCTGRCRVFIPKQVAEIGFDGMVAGCGTAIYYEGQKKMHATLPQKLQREIAEDMLRCRLDGVLEGDRYCYFQDEPFLPWVKKFYHDNGVFLDRIVRKNGSRRKRWLLISLPCGSMNIVISMVLNQSMKSSLILYGGHPTFMKWFPRDIPKLPA